MRRVIPLLLLCALALRAAPPEAPGPEEVAALLLSPDAARRVRAEAILAADRGRAFEEALLGQIGRRGHDIAGWLADLADRSRKAEGAALLEVERIRDALIGCDDLNVGLDFYAVGVSDALAEALLGERQGTRVGENAAAWDAVWKKILDDPASEVLGWIAAGGRDRCPATSRFERRIAYVQGIEVDAQGIATPKVASLTIGARADWTPAVSADRREITLHLDLAASDLARPIRTREIQLGATKAQVQEPELTGATARRTVTIPAGGYALVGLPGPKGTALLLFQAVVGPPRCQPPPSREKEREEGSTIR